MINQTSLEDYRSQLDQLDGQIVTLLAQRLDVCRQVAEYKKERGIPVMQTARVQVVKQQAAERARLVGLREDFVAALYDAIISEACRLEYGIVDSDSEAHQHAQHQ